MPADGQAAPAWNIRSFRANDVKSLANILQDAAEAAQWPLESYERMAGLPGAVALVCEAGNRLTGFLIARQVADEAEVLNLAVLTGARRKGQASALLVAAFDQFRRLGVTRAFLEVRESNQPAIAFYRKHGFTPTGRRNAYYRDPVEDALCLQKQLATDAG